MSFRVGIAIPQTAELSEPAAIVELARAAEAAGYASLWAQDRLLTPPGVAGVDPASPDPVALLTLVGAVTERIRVGTNVLAGPWYPPVPLARSLTTLDVLTSGRLSVGIGLGRSSADLAAAGVATRHLAARTDELLDVLDAVWGPDPVAYTGARVHIPASAVRPKPTQQPRPPVLLAARTPAGLGRAARRADGWAPAGLPPHALAPMWRVVRELAAGHGRDPDALQMVARAEVELTDRPLDADRACYCGSLEQVGEDLRQTGAAGAHEIILAAARPASVAALLDMCAALVIETGITVPA